MKMGRALPLRRFLFWSTIALFFLTLLVVGIQIYRILVNRDSSEGTVFGGGEQSDVLVFFFISIAPGIILTLLAYGLLRRPGGPEERARALGFYILGGTLAVSINAFLSGLIVRESPLGLTSISQTDVWAYKVGVAPVVEEVAKTVPILAVPWMLRGYNPVGSYRIPAVWVGALYGFVVAGFFAGFETYFYSADALTLNGLESGLETAMLRTLGIVGHLSSTGLAAAGVTYALFVRRSYVVPPIAFAVAVFLHAAMNYLAAVQQSWTFLFAPAAGFACLLLLLAYVRWRTRPRREKARTAPTPVPEPTPE